jgi:nucleotide-binding universal stress UspA family protein
MMAEGVLLPHDLTELSDAALDTVQRLGTRPRDLHVLHVLPRIEPSEPGPAAKSRSTESSEAAHTGRDLRQRVASEGGDHWPRSPVMIWPRDEDERRLEHARQALHRRLQGTPYEHAVLHVQIGEPASRIVALAQELGVDKIVMPTHSRSGLSRLVLGSVTEHVVRFASCPVLVLPAAVIAPRAPLSADPTAVDQSPEEQVHGLACKILRKVAETEGHLVAVRVALPPGRDPSWWEEALRDRLATSGIEFIDLVFTPARTQQAHLLDLRFDDAGFT